MGSKWLKNPGKLPYAFFVLLLVFVASLLALGEALCEKWGDFSFQGLA
jgi:hypothetical protein